MLPDADPVFYRYVIANRDSALDESMIADIAVRTNNHVLQYMSKRPDARALTNRICFDQRVVVDEWCAHRVNWHYRS